MTHYVILAVNLAGNIRCFGPYVSKTQADNDWTNMLVKEAEGTGDLDLWVRDMRIVAAEQPLCYA